MKKKLSDMTLEELWPLFPIVLTGPSKDWKNWFNEEYSLLKDILPQDEIHAIHHIGSTAIENIWSKPIVDILVEINSKSDFTKIKSLLISANYLCMSEGESRLSFNKGYTEDGYAPKVYHLHLRLKGDNDEIYFRDYLNKYPLIAKEYETLKISLWKQFTQNRDAYTEMKTAFVKEQTQKAEKQISAAN